MATRPVSLLTRDAILARGISDSQALGTQPPPEIARQVVAFAAPYLGQDSSEAGREAGAA